jgi:thiamine biosynthesis lipoprotein
MGTWASLTLVTADSASVADLAYDALMELHRVDSLMSNWSEKSEVARINRDASRAAVTVHPEVAAVIDLALRVNRDSAGAFDITVEPLVRLWGFLGGQKRVPREEEIVTALKLVGSDKIAFDAPSRTLHFSRQGVRIDLGGVAKGYGADAVAKILRRSTVTDALVDLSGNMVALGDAAYHEGWTVGIRDPSGARAHLGRVHLYDEAISTSGDYEQFADAGGKRYGHILDPRTGSPARGLSSVTVVPDRAMAADAWSTALFVLGSEVARRVARERDDLAVVLIEPQDTGGLVVWVEAAIADRFEPQDTSDNRLLIRTF